MKAEITLRRPGYLRSIVLYSQEKEGRALNKYAGVYMKEPGAGKATW